MKKRYKEFFRKDCTLEEAENGVCALPEEELDEGNEGCPYKNAGGGRCASADNNTKLKGVCQKDYKWSASKEICYKP